MLYTHGKLKVLDQFDAGRATVAAEINHAGALVGSMLVSGDVSGPTHPFLYRHGELTDLGTLAGQRDNSAQAINNAGRVAGHSELADRAGLSECLASMIAFFASFAPNAQCHARVSMHI